MNLETYNYQYALVPYQVAKEKLDLGWRKADKNGNVLINSTEIKCLTDNNTEQIIELGGKLLTPEQAKYYRKTTSFSFKENVSDAIEPTENSNNANESGNDTENNVNENNSENENSNSDSENDIDETEENAKDDSVEKETSTDESIIDNTNNENTTENE